MYSFPKEQAVDFKDIKRYPGFDWQEYLLLYPNLKKNGVNTEAKAIRHWLLNGRKEGREYSFSRWLKMAQKEMKHYPDFDWQEYVVLNSDLKHMGIETKEALICHWLLYGRKEGRVYRKNAQKAAGEGTSLLKRDEEDNKLRLHPDLLDCGLTFGKKPGSIGCAKGHKRITFPKTTKPIVSIVIPVYNQFLQTYLCLKTVANTIAGLEYEVILCDDASTGAIKNIHKFTKNLRVVRNRKNLGFLRSCNRAAGLARGEYLVFLNNDTTPRKDWLNHMVRIANADPKVGIVGARLFFPDGWLQEAGCIIFKDATGWNYGRGKDSSSPEYNYVKEVDYVSGACLMVRRSLWKTIGGFDTRYSPAYFEDTDLAFEVRKRGYKVIYQSQAEVVHYEGVSSGTDESSGVKKYQVINRAKFLKKWAKVLSKDHVVNGEKIFLSRDRSLKKKTIVVIDHYVPTFDQDAGSKCMFQYLKFFKDMGMNVKFIGDNFACQQPYTAILQQMGIEVLYGSWYQENIKNWILRNSQYIDFFFLSRPHITEKYIDDIRRNTKAKILYFGHDLHYLRLMRQFEATKDPKALEDAEKSRQLEISLCNKADVAFYPSDAEIRELEGKVKLCKRKKLPLYIFDGTDKQVYHFKERYDLLFVGSFNHPPNPDGIKWFLDEVFPKVLKKLPGVRLYVIGSNTPEWLKQYASENVHVIGWVSDEDLQGYFRKTRLLIVPLRFGAGIKGKILEAMYNGTPVVTTKVGAEGIKTTALSVAQGADDFSRRIVSLYTDRRKLVRMSLEGVKFIKQNYSKHAALKAFEGIFQF
ncbi:MAG: glycosyltransferase [Candidatus Omnitrophica bacterium]|nr:glycosyltransferase [Candidatus Omnitrophota bacterium]